MVAKNNPVLTKLSKEDLKILYELLLELQSLRTCLSSMQVITFDDNILEFNTLVSDLVDFINSYSISGNQFNISILHSFAKSTNLFTKHFLNSTNELSIRICQTLRVIELRFELLYYSLLFDFKSEFGNLN